MITEEQIEQAQAMYHKGMSLNDVLLQMQQEGVSLIGSIRLVMKLTDSSLADARDTVLDSVAWGDHKEHFWEVQKAFWDAWDKADEEDQQESAKSV